MALQARILVRKHRAKTDLIQKYVIVQFSLASDSILLVLSLILLLISTLAAMVPFPTLASVTAFPQVSYPDLSQPSS